MGRLKFLVIMLVLLLMGTNMWQGIIEIPYQEYIYGLILIGMGYFVLNNKNFYLAKGKFARSIATIVLGMLIILTGIVILFSFTIPLGNFGFVVENFIYLYLLGIAFIYVIYKIGKDIREGKVSKSSRSSIRRQMHARYQASK